MGAVYEGRHLRLGRRVALKTLHVGLATDPMVLARFVNEGRASALVDHPNVIAVHDVGVDGDVPFLVMDYLEGHDLAAEIHRTKRIPTSKIISWMIPILKALSFTHKHGIVHRDLKPENLFLQRSADGTVVPRILDFGISKLREDVSLVRTTTAQFLGTPYYMSPEQARSSKSVDARSDLFSIGVILYECATGHRPFEAESLFELLAKIVSQEPPHPRSFAADLPPDFAALLVKALAKNPDERFQTAEELASALEALDVVDTIELASTLPSVGVAEVGPGERHPTPYAGVSLPLRPRLGVYLVGAVAVVVLGGFGFWWLEDSNATARNLAPPPAAPRASPEPPPIVGSGATDSNGPSPVSSTTGSWAHVEASPTTRLGLPDEGRDDETGFRPAREVHGPEQSFEIQTHEVSWAAWEAWSHEGARALVRPATATPRHPVTGVSWELARDYCRSLGGDLPTEAQWELAARGVALRPAPWGDERLDLARTAAYRGVDATPDAVGTNDQDRTPGRTPVWDLAGNAEEWTLDLYRDDFPGVDEGWVQTGTTSFRAVRGLPLTARSPPAMPRILAAVRLPLCATGECSVSTEEARRTVGFRCARPWSE